MSTEPTPETLSQLMDGEWQDIDRSACVAGLCGNAELRARWARMHMARDVMKGEAVLPGLSLADRVRSAIADEPAYSNVVGLAAEAPPALVAPVNSLAAPAVASSGLRSFATAPEPARARLAASAVSGQRVAHTTAPRPGLSSRTRSGFAGFGLAATVALATVVGLSLWQGAPQQAPDDAIATLAGPDDGVLDPLASAPGEIAATIAVPRLPSVELVGNSGSYWTSPAQDGDAVRSADEERLNDFLVQHLESAPSASREGLLPYSRLVGYDDPGVGVSR